MTLLDSNVWLALALSGHDHHLAARRWLAAQATAGSLLFCRSTQLAVLRLLTTPAVLRPFGNPPLTNEEAWKVYAGFRADRRVGFADEPAGLERHWQEFAVRPGPSPKVWMDAYLAAFAVASGCRLVTIDAAFRQFAGLDVTIVER